MKNRYEALLVLNAQGTEDTIKDIIDRLESDFKKEGAEIEQVQKMDKRPFAYVAGELDAGHFAEQIVGHARGAGAHLLTREHVYRGRRIARGFGRA
jgi:ribosomal protein S6